MPLGQSINVTDAMLDAFFDTLHEADMEIVYAEQPPSDCLAPANYSDAGNDVLGPVREGLARALAAGESG